MIRVWFAWQLWQKSERDDEELDDDEGVAEGRREFEGFAVNISHRNIGLRA